MSRSSNITLENPALEYGVLQRVWLNCIFVSIIILVSFSDMAVYRLTIFALFGLLITYLHQFHVVRQERNRDAKIKYYISFFAIILGLILFLLPTNIFYFRLDVIFPLKWWDASTLSSEFWLHKFWEYYGWLTIFSFISMVLTILYLKRKNIRISSGSGGDKVSSIFQYFIERPTFKKIFILSMLLIVASFMEEIIYRYTIFNFMLLIQIPFVLAVLISALIFGVAHSGNGFIIYVINSSFAGIFFAICFYEYGLIASWLLHLFWNVLVVVEQYITLLGSRR